jgi:sec-independent protein translocase protein TatB
MLGLGFGEMILLAGIALVVMGPEKFPDVAKVFIRSVRDIRGYWDDAKTELTKEINPLKKEFNQLNKYKPEEFIDHLAGKDHKNEEDDPALAEPGAAGYGVKVPEVEAAQPGPDPNNPYASPTPKAQPYNPSGSAETSEPATSDAAVATPASDEELDPLDDLNPPPRLET